MKSINHYESIISSQTVSMVIVNFDEIDKWDEWCECNDEDDTEYKYEDEDEEWNDCGE